MADRMFAEFSLGQIVHHVELGYRGVIVDVDPMFLGDCETAALAVSDDEPLERPWYHVLADGRDHVTYVCETMLTADDSGKPVTHPSLSLFFTSFEGSHYTPRRVAN
ncbi:MAG: heat shock protein HspQ [Rhodospirillales bacterium]|nr:MAG: heat shock protein HspQ [Rhodospirillales bacterium]